MNTKETIDTSTEAVELSALDLISGKALRLEAENAELRKQLTAETARADRAEADLNETFVDDTGLAWSRPTAEAYYLACRLRDRLKSQLTAANEKLASVWRTDWENAPKDGTEVFAFGQLADEVEPPHATVIYFDRTRNEWIDVDSWFFTPTHFMLITPPDTKESQS